MRYGRQILLVLVLSAEACAPALGPTISPDLPATRRFPENHPPDGQTVAREPEKRWENKLRMAYNRMVVPIDWALFGLVVALQPYGAIRDVDARRGFCAVGPVCP